MPSTNPESPNDGEKEQTTTRVHTRPLDLHSSFVRNTFTLSDGQPREFLWSCQLTKESPEFTWDFEEEEDDLDFLSHTLFLRHAVVGKGAKEGERYLIEVETKDYAEKDILTPLVRLTPGKDDMVGIDLNFSHEIPVTFRLVEGSGPIHLNGQHLAELPPEKEDEEDELETEYTEGETATEGDTAESDGGDDNEGDEDEEEEDEEEEESPAKAKKRKGSKQLASKKSKVRGKLDSHVSTGTEEDEEDEEDEEESMDEDEESTPEKKKKKGGKASAATKRPTAKALKTKMKAQPAVPKTKGKKAGKAK